MARRVEPPGRRFQAPWAEVNVIKVNLEEAAEHLGELVEQAAAGYDVVISSEDGSAVRLVPAAAGGRTDRVLRAPRGGGDALDRFIGTWSPEQLELLRAIDVCRRADDSMWK
jgi:antitoxin (DNA-binding transcriptional repressor) of toxin-antitoxin stability system